VVTERVTGLVHTVVPPMLSCAAMALHPAARAATVLWLRPMVEPNPISLKLFVNEARSGIMLSLTG